MPSYKLLLIVITISCLLTGCGPNVDNYNNTGEEVICFGDSLTQGYGANPGEDYPSVLGRISGWPVINAGVSGNTTRQALERINSDVLARNPKLVIVQFGANDFFQKIPKEETRANLDQIVFKIQEKGAMAAIAGVRIGLLVDEYDDVFRQVAKNRKAIYIPNIMKDVLTDPTKKSDEIHPNAKGYVLMAQRIYEKVKPFMNKEL